MWGEEFGLVCVQGGSEGLVVTRSHAGAGSALQLSEEFAVMPTRSASCWTSIPRLHALGADSRPSTA